MEIDDVSLQITRLALYLDKLVPGSVSEVWLDPKLVSQIKKSLPKHIDLDDEAFVINSKVSLLTDKRRKKYLYEMLEALTYQITIAESESKEFTLTEFLQKCFGFNITHVDESVLKILEEKMKSLEAKLRKSRFEIIAERKVNKNSLLKEFKSYVQKSKDQLASYFNYPEQEEFELELATNKPWTAFNYHLRPFVSKLTLNKDIAVTDISLQELAIHEGYGGHHLELMLKDRLLLEGRGEHGFVLTYSPQTFMSEAIAMTASKMFELRRETREAKLIRNYERMIFALQNLITFKIHDEGLEKKDIRTVLDRYNIAEDTKDIITNFTTDKVLGIYSLVYYSAYNFLNEIYDKAENKEELINEIYTMPTTANLLLEKYLA